MKAPTAASSRDVTLPIPSTGVCPVSPLGYQAPDVSCCDKIGSTSSSDITEARQMTTATEPQTPANEHALRAEVQAKLVSGTATQVQLQARDHAFTIDEPASLGGTDLGANPVEHLLAALGACQVITFQVWAQKLGLKLDTVDVDLRGDLDLRGFFGLDPQVRPGFQSIEVDVTITGPEDEARYAELVEAVEKHCPVLDNLGNTVPVAATFTSN